MRGESLLHSSVLCLGRLAGTILSSTTRAGLRTPLVQCKRSGTGEAYFGFSLVCRLSTVPTMTTPTTGHPNVAVTTPRWASAMTTSPGTQRGTTVRYVLRAGRGKGLGGVECILMKAPIQPPAQRTHALAVTHSLTHSFTHSPTHSLTHSLIHSLTRARMDALAPARYVRAHSLNAFAPRCLCSNNESNTGRENRVV